MIPIRFEYDRASDVHVAFPVCHLITEDDCVAWAATCAEYCVPLKRKIDLVVVGEMFTVEPSIRARWCEYRRAVLSRFTRYFVRVGFDMTLVAGISRTFDPTRVCADDVPSAIAMIRHLRATDARPTASL